MGHYCCFLCPGEEHTERTLDELCLECGHPYGLPLSNAPTSIGTYRVVKPLSRGFYAATYVAERGPLQQKVVLKVSPKSVLSWFGKNFEEQCRRHAAVSEGTEHLVQIRDMFSADVTFNFHTMPCHVAELAYIEGDLLSDHVDGRVPTSVESGSQIAIDLLRLLEELQKKRVHHNDLHAENIIVQGLQEETRRANAIDGLVRAVAIDLGSLSDASRSDSDVRRHGDMGWIAVHIQRLCHVLLRDPDGISDRDNRVVHALLGIAQGLSADAEKQRTPGIPELIETIESAYYRQPQHWAPWRQPPVMKTYGASYNAQTMQPWHVPYLLVDPDDEWRNSISSPGPQIITGMRGCGKTMLLRALQFHARAAQLDGESDETIRRRIHEDNYVGLFVSAQRLLDPLGTRSSHQNDSFVRLFVAYALEAVRALMHLRDVTGGGLSERPDRILADAVRSQLEGKPALARPTSDHDLEIRLEELLLAVTQGGGSYSLRGHPSSAFPDLAGALRKCAVTWSSVQVLFLLDDVSTRYLQPDRIRELLSTLLFQNDWCGFKLTSEAQTIYPHLWSPGQIHPARVGRDVKVFDLGARVYEKIKTAGEGNNVQFVARILKQRAKYTSGHPNRSPDRLLGSVPLERIAVDITSSRKNSRKRKSIYRGVRALAGMCVGDIGDVISLYEQILRAWSKRTIPIPATTQSECFQDFCARRLYDLNRRGGVLMDTAKAFAQASNALLMRSGDRRRKRLGSGRIRQYSAIYVRVTTGDKERQMTRLRELVDAGVFVFAGGSSVPRSKTRDANPAEQFKLTYRKIYGIVNYIGLSDRDRFELSGKNLEEWIEEPADGKSVLLRNQVSRYEEVEDDDIDTESLESDGSNGGSGTGTDGEGDGLPVMQGLLFDTADVDEEAQQEDTDIVARRKPVVSVLGPTGPNRANVTSVVVGLGFEERTRTSVERLLESVEPKQATAIRYSEAGYGEDIRRALERGSVEFSELGYGAALREGLPKLDGGVVVDITGLAKPVIFEAVRNELRAKGRVWVCHTEAETYYPRDSDLAGVLRAWEKSGHYGLLEELPKMLTGEAGPYVHRRLLVADSDESRQRALFAFSTAKNQRLLSLLDERDYDRLEIVVPAGVSTRSRVASLVGEVAATNHGASKVQRIGVNDLEGTLKYLASRYNALYVDGRQNFDVGLTGTKLQAVACAAGSAAFKMSQAWYPQPQKFDVQRFTTGAGRTTYYEIRLQRQATSIR